MLVISNGFHKMHLTIAAHEADRRGLLTLAITGIYPTPLVRSTMRALGLSDKGRAARLLERDEGLPEDRLAPLFLAETLDEAARLLARRPAVAPHYPAVGVGTMRLYGRAAARRLARTQGGRIFHFRAGFGGASIRRARSDGMVVLCDHALAHPALLDDLVEHRGRVPWGEVGRRARFVPAPRGALAAAALHDIDAADAVVVNSNFVKDTFLTAGWDPAHVHVVPLGVDDNFLADMPCPQRRVERGPLRIVFASRFEQHKGAVTVIEALERLGDEVDWRLDVAGPATPEIEAAHGGFFADPRVRVLGPLARPAFKRQLLDHPVFVFPSYAEGSARAVFDALVCGCYAIVTPNAGSVVEDGRHGAVVPPGDAGALAEAIVAADRDRQRVAEIGMGNHEMVLARYRQSHYGDSLAALYERLLAGGGG